MPKASTDCLAIASSSILGLKITILSKNANFRPKTELEAIARWSVDASREVDCAYFGNIGRNSGYFLLPIFLGSYLTAHSFQLIYMTETLPHQLIRPMLHILMEFHVFFLMLLNALKHCVY